MLSYDDIKVTVNGKAVTPTDAAGRAIEPFIIDGTTYLPVRAVANALGLEVGWDQATKTVKLGKGETTSNNNQSVPSGTYSRSNPAPLGTIQTAVIESYSGDYNVSMVVLESVRGDAAWQKIKAGNMFNDAAPNGKEYVLVKVRASLNSVTTDKAVSISDFDLKAYSSSNSSYDSAPVVNPEPDFCGSLYAGGSREGYAVFTVDQNDKAPKFVYGAKYDGSGGIWFAMTK